MGIQKVPIQVGDLNGSQFRQLTAPVEPGSTLTLVPASIFTELEVRRVDCLLFELADNSSVEYDVGCPRIRLGGKEIVGPVVFALTLCCCPAKMSG